MGLIGYIWVSKMVQEKSIYFGASTDGNSKNWDGPLDPDSSSSPWLHVLNILDIMDG